MALADVLTASGTGTGTTRRLGASLFTLFGSPRIAGDREGVGGLGYPPPSRQHSPPQAGPDTAAAAAAARYVARCQPQQPLPEARNVSRCSGKEPDHQPQNDDDDPKVRARKAEQAARIILASCHTGESVKKRGELGESVAAEMNCEANGSEGQDP
ncbi:hypothetical protein MMYC01_204780, partial [Madurella mycetomatis]